MRATPTPRKMTRPPFERMKYLHERLAAGKYPNCTSVAGHFEVSPKTIQRDLDYMRDRFSLPIAYDPARRGYRYTQRVGSLPTVQMTDEEWSSLLVARQALMQFQGTPWTEKMEKVIAKISSDLDELISASGIDTAVSFRHAGTADVDESIFRRICEAVLQHREVHFRYRKFSSSRPDHRRVRPYHICCVNGAWHVIGLNLERKLIRVYALERIHELKVTETTFERPRDFSAQDYFGRTFGIIAEEGMMQVRLRFRGRAAWSVRQRHWHSSQRVVPLPDGELELQFEVSSIREIVSWVMGWGHEVTVVAPAQLADEVANRAREILALYHPVAAAAPGPSGSVQSAA